MGRFIVKLGGKYLEWSTVVDAPVTSGMTFEEFKEYYREEYGRKSMGDLARRLERVERTGTSAFEDESVDDTIAGNRAGDRGQELTKEEIIAQYCK